MNSLSAFVFVFAQLALFTKRNVCYVLSDLTHHELDNFKQAFMNKLGLYNIDYKTDSNEKGVNGSINQEYLLHLYGILENLPDDIGEISIYPLKQSSVTGNCFCLFVGKVYRCLQVCTCQYKMVWLFHIHVL